MRRVLTVMRPGARTTRGARRCCAPGDTDTVFAPSTAALAQVYPRRMSRIFTTSVSSVYPHYVTKVEKKGRTKAELHQVIEWLTGFDDGALNKHLAEGTTFADFFAAARLHPQASSITGTICGVRIEEIDDPLMQKIRYLDKLVDELAKGRPMEKVLRT
jgi:hypothetical protein